MKRLSVMAMVVAAVALGVSTFALWRTYDAEDQQDPSSSTVTTGSGTTIDSTLVVVPSVIGRSRAAAEAALTGVDLESDVTEVPSVNVAKGRVITQDPLPDTVVPRGSVIQLTISSGPA